jgi:hypothetical protein
MEWNGMEWKKNSSALLYFDCLTLHCRVETGIDDIQPAFSLSYFPYVHASRGTYTGDHDIEFLEIQFGIPGRR